MTFYNNSVPNSGDSLGSTRLPIHDNFVEIFTVNGINHVDFNLADKGKHKFLQMPEQLSAPATATNEGGFYTKVGTNPAETNLFFRGENGGFEYQLTHVDQSLIATFGIAKGWTYLPGGLIVNYGKDTPGTYNFAKPFPNNVFSITATSNTGIVAVTILTPGVAPYLTYQIAASGGPTVSWIAIGN